MPRNLDKLRGLLAELFQLNQADLDFGIYRIMNQKRDEITAFLDNDLLPQVRTELTSVRDNETTETKTELDKLVQQLSDAGVDPDTSPKVRELRERYSTGGDLDVLENEVFSHLYDFFRRYYDEGDFISQRRYKEGVYAIPYEGEEVKVYWANHDQYYVKSTENFRDYAFKLPSGKRVHFKVVEAALEKDNRKAAQGSERRFLLHEELPVEEVNGELIARFEFRPDPDKRKAAAINVASAERIAQELTEGDFDPGWRQGLATKMPTDKSPDRTLLDKQLADYTARNTFDYFIHKHLGHFLRRELDFYIKNEIMHLDDIEGESATRVEQYLSKVRAVRRIAHKIIDFLAQIEDFQKKLWLKKKFVVETNYCITLDRIPEEFYPEIAANDAQREQWVELFAIDEIEAKQSDDLLEEATPGYSTPLTVEFLKTNDKLQVDTALFDSDFKDRLCATIHGLDEHCDAVLVSSENFQALQLLMARYSAQINCAYADPPYNTDGSPILYKNAYKDSTWMSLMSDRLALTKQLLHKRGVLCTTIDDFEYKELNALIELLYGPENVAGTVVIRSNPSGRPIPSGFAISHEYAIFATRESDVVLSKLPRTEKQLARYREQDEDGRFMWELFRKRGSGSRREDRRTMYYPLYAEGSRIRVPQMHWNEESSEWIADEEPTETERVLYPIDEEDMQRRWRWKHDAVTADPSQFRVDTKPDGRDVVYYKYRPAQDTVLPLTVWADSKYSATEHGTGQLKKLFATYNVFDYPKSVFAVEDCLRVSGLGKTGVCIDPFAGSGTTAHAIVNMNRQDSGARKCVLVEMGHHFDAVLRPRIAKAYYASDWDAGKEALDDIHKYNKVVNEQDVPHLHYARVVSKLAGLVRLYKGKFGIAKSRAALLRDDRAAELFRCLFVAFFRKFNLAYTHRVAFEANGLQTCAAYTLYRLGVVAKDWQQVFDLPVEVLLPTVREQIEAEIRGHEYWTTDKLLTSRLMRWFIEWGMLEGRYEQEDKFFKPLKAVRVTSLYSAFLQFKLDPANAEDSA